MGLPLGFLHVIGIHLKQSLSLHLADTPQDWGVFTDCLCGMLWMRHTQQLMGLSTLTFARDEQ